MATQRTSIKLPSTTFSLLILITCLYHIYAIEWLALANHRPEIDWKSTTSCKMAPGIVSKQAKQLCKRNLDAMPSIVKAAKLTIKTCQEQFSDRRWNCSSLMPAPGLKSELAKETREGAYVQALSAAAIAFSIAYECHLGSIASCGCDRISQQKKPFDDAMGVVDWGTCGDFIQFGMDFSSRFTDSKQKNYMNEHNSRVGRLAFESSSQLYCRCHGFKGCTFKTCWKTLPRMEDIALKLTDKYMEAFEVVVQHTENGTTLVPSDPNITEFTKNDLIYLQPSPDYCEPDPGAGLPGTVGRLCNRTTIGNHMQYNWCDYMCCGRGYRSEVRKIVEERHCRYLWCCDVKCEKYERAVESRALALANHRPEIEWKSKTSCKMAPGIVSKQAKKVCKRNLDAMPSIVKAAKLTIKTCQEQFSGRRWNCSSLMTAPGLKSDLAKGELCDHNISVTREGAYVQALSAAAIAFSIARECHLGSIASCGCDRISQQNKTFDDSMGVVDWGTCGDFIQFGMDFSSRFTDSKQKNNMNEHNSRVGRLAFESSSQLYCRCHGFKGCTLKTCWKTLPRMEDIATKLTGKYMAAFKVVEQRTENGTTLVPRDLNVKFTKNDLIYLQSSPDYCKPDPKAGLPGTVGRFCNRRMNIDHMPYNLCEYMCCGRGYRTEVMEVVEECYCRYHWCCNVTCDTCTRAVEVNICK
ncbi:uncharacterized protein LOC144451277 [Glandiceps talaboti]